MRIEFNELSELQKFVEWAGFKRPDLVTLDLRLDTTALAETVKEAIDEAAVPLTEIDGETPREHSAGEIAQTVQPKQQLIVRKRRTKAEMEAARAAEAAAPGETSAVAAEAAQPDGSATTAAESAASASTPGAGNPFAQPELPAGKESTGAPPAQAAAAPTGDLAEFLASRLTERPELTAVEHLNLARGFIAKHGMARYNESFPLAGLNANVMAFSAADCAKHAAVLDYLGSE